MRAVEVVPNYWNTTRVGLYTKFNSASPIRQRSYNFMDLAEFSGSTYAIIGRRYIQPPLKNEGN